MQSTNIMEYERIPFHNTSFDCPEQSQLEVFITQDPIILSKAKKLRLKFHANYLANSMATQSFKNNTLQSKELIKQQEIIIHDGYDSFAEHLVIRNKHDDSIVAYVRLIDTYTAYKIGGYYCETRFNLNHLFNKQTFYMEMSRLVLDQAYNSTKLAKLMWSGIIQHAKSKGVDSIFGSLSLSLEHEAKTYALLNYLKRNHMSAYDYRVVPYQILPDKSRLKNTVHRTKNPLLDYFFVQGAKLCGDAYWNRDFNSAELFLHYPIQFDEQLL